MPRNYSPDVESGPKNSYDPLADFHAVKRIVAYSPDQERDENGRFASSGGGDAKSYAEITRSEHDAMTGEHSTELTSEEKYELSNYMTLGYLPVNGYLRELGTARELGTTEEKVTAQIDHLDSAFSKSEGLPHDAVLYRIVRADVFAKLRSGDSFVDKGFVSTSFDGDGLRQVVAAADVPNVGVIIHASAGLPVLRGTHAEKEVILPRGLRFVVESREGKSITVRAER